MQRRSADDGGSRLSLRALQAKAGRCRRLSARCRYQATTWERIRTTGRFEASLSCRHGKQRGPAALTDMSPACRLQRQETGHGGLTSDPVGDLIVSCVAERRTPDESHRMPPQYSPHFIGGPADGQQKSSRKPGEALIKWFGEHSPEACRQQSAFCPLHKALLPGSWLIAGALEPIRCTHRVRLTCGSFVAIETCTSKQRCLAVLPADARTVRST